MEISSPGKSRKSLITLLTSRAASATATKTVVNENITRINPSRIQHQIQESPSSRTGRSRVSRGLKNLHVTTDNEENEDDDKQRHLNVTVPYFTREVTATTDVTTMGERIGPSAGRHTNDRRLENPLPTAAAIATTAMQKQDVRYDPLPFRVTAASETGMNQRQMQPQQELYHPSSRPVAFRQQQREEDYITVSQRRQVLEGLKLPVDRNPYYETVPQQRQRRRQRQRQRQQLQLQLEEEEEEQRYQYTSKEDDMIDRQSQWQLETAPDSPPPTPCKNATIDHSVNTDPNFLLEPAAIWMNNSTGVSTDICNEKTRVVEARQSSSNHQSILNEDDDSDPIPIQQHPPHFHSLPADREERRKKQKQQDFTKFQRGKNPITTTETNPVPGLPGFQGRTTLLESFQGRQFYPPLPFMPQTTNPQQQLQQYTERPPVTNRNIFHNFEHKFFLQSQLPPVVHRWKNLPPPQIPIPTRGVSPVPDSGMKNKFAHHQKSETGNDVPQKRPRFPDEDSCRYDSRTLPKKRPRFSRSFPDPPDACIVPKNKPINRGLSSSKGFGAGRTPGGGDTYIRRLHDMLEEAPRQGFDHIVSWQPHGRAFKIHSPDEFSQNILPKYFHTKRIDSFRRWLSAWGFAKHGEGVNRGAIYHRYFVRGVVLSLVSKLTREKMARSMEGWLAPGEVPNFYDADSDPTTTSHTIRRVDPPSTGRTVKAGGCEKGNGQTEADGIHNRCEDKPEELGTPLDDPPMALHENPKLLRGRILENVRLMLREAKEKGFEDIVSWLPGGKAFKIHKSSEFQKEVCGKYFRTSKIHSFSDTLRTWGFCRLNKVRGIEHNAYYHRLFQEGKPHLCRHYSRTEMVKAMKDFREEQKRQIEISWSFFPRHREEQRGTTAAAREGNLKRQSSKLGDMKEQNDIIPGDDDIGDGEDIENGMKRIDDDEPCPSDPLEMEATTAPHSQDYFNSYLGLTRTDNAENSSIAIGGGNNNNAIEMDRSIRNPNSDNYVIDPCYQILDSGTMGTTDATLYPTERKFDSKKSNEIERTSRTLHETIITTSMSYITRIHRMLEDVEEKGEQDVVSWRSHGRAFKIHDENAFRSKILPRYFLTSSLANFSRWLSHWGFLRIRAGKDRKCWYHRLFVRGVVELLTDVTRDQLFDAMEKLRAPGMEPDFYCSGKGEEISELPLSTVATKNTTMPNNKKSLDENVTSGLNESSKAKAAPNNTTDDLVGTKPSPLKREKHPRHLRGTMLENLREMLDAVRDEGESHIVDWLVHGKAFKIHQAKAFNEKILHRFFKTSKYRYFNDGLRNWGFVIIKNGKDKGAFHHKYFLRDEPRLCQNLSRTQMKTAMKDWSCRKSATPDFYAGDDEKDTARDDDEARLR